MTWLLGLIPLAVLAIACAHRTQRGSREDRTEATSRRLLQARDDEQDFFARARRDAAKLKRKTVPDLPPGSITPAAKMPPAMPLPVRRRSRRRNRNVSR